MNTFNATAYVVDDSIEVKTLTIDGAEKHVAEIRVSIRRRPRRDKKREPIFITLEVWGLDALNAAKYLRKGSAIGITAELDYNEWTDKDSGKTRRKHFLISRQIDFLDRIGRPAAGPHSDPGQGDADSAESNEPGPVAEDDIPF